MKKFVGFSKIGQYRGVIGDVTHHAQYVGTDADGNVTMNRSATMPVIPFKGTVKLHGCLHASTNIKLWDGSYTTIQNIVENRLCVDLCGVDMYGNIVKTSITNWYNNGRLQECDWISFNFSRNSMGQTSYSSIRCTPNHKFYIHSKCEYIEASNISIGDDVLVIRNGCELSFTQQQILIGKMLGDGSLCSDHIEFNQIDKLYIDETIKNLGNIGYIQPIDNVTEYISGYGSTMYRGRTIDKFFIREYFSGWFDGDNKQVPEDIILSPIAMAYWYMDDGSLSHTETQEDRASFATCSFNENSVDILISKFKPYGMNAIKYKSDNDKYWRIRLNSKCSYILFQLISPYIIPSMRYKLPIEFRNDIYYTGTSIINNTSVLDTKVQVITNITSGLKGENNLNRYDIETSTHNFFANGVLVHNSNAGVAMDAEDEFWCQSRNNIITPEHDNAGFAFFAYARKDILSGFIKDIRSKLGLTTETIIIFGEWCCGNIQKGVAITGLDKMFVIFAVKVAVNANEDEDSHNMTASNYYLPDDVWSGYRSPNDKIYNINDFETYTIDIDFNEPEMARNEMIDIMSKVEKECPVGKAFGRKLGEDNTTGEGNVWVGWWNGRRYVFKVKGSEHSVTKVKTLAPVNVEKLNSVKEFVEYSVTENRLNQAIEQVFTAKSIEPSIKATGDFLRWVINDITSEETDTMVSNNLEPKDVNKNISDSARKWFTAYLDSIVGLGCNE